MSTRRYRNASRSEVDSVLEPKNSIRSRFVLWGSFAVAAVALIAVVSVLTGAKVTSRDSRVEAGYTGVKVPDFTLSAVRGGVVREPWLDHRPAVVFFFASWCLPCQREIPKIAKYLNTHHLGDGRVAFFGLDGDTYKSDAVSFMNTDHVRFPVGFNPSDSVIQGDFRISFFPDTEFVSAKGVIQQVHFGAITPAELSHGVEELLDVTTNAAA
jgi:thiol-disulfide isomerase/thioredoxin